MQTLQRGKQFSMTRNRHRLQRILEPMPTIAADFVRMAFEGKDAAQLRVMTAEGKIQRTG